MIIHFFALLQTPYKLQNSEQPSGPRLSYNLFFKEDKKLKSYVLVILSLHLR